MPKEGGVFTTKESTELLQYIAAKMVTREDVSEIVIAAIEEKVPPIVNKIVGKAKNEIMDYVDKKDREYKGELNLALQKEDKKVDAVIEILSEKKLISKEKSEELKNLTPFPSAA